jgi:GNAT superfamily N-acetyltransferase
MGHRLLPNAARPATVVSRRPSQVEAVHVRDGHRGHGLGAAMVRWAVDGARRRGCALVQLTSDKQRTDAHRFYERLGFHASHEGFKLQL